MLKTLAACLIIALILISCRTYDATLTFYDIDKPMQLGNFASDVPVDSLRTVSGYFEFEEVEDTYSENENTSITMSGGEYISSNLDSTVLNPLYAHPSIFIGNSTIQLEIKHGIRVGAFIFGTIAASITGEESDIGTYTIQRFNQKSILYDIESNGVNNEE